MGRNARGELARAGGWGPLLGDEGSGYAIALEGLRAVLRARDGCEAATVLADRLPPVLQLVDWDELVSRVYGGQLDREGIAALSPQVFAAARDGDAVAGRIVAAAGAALGRQVGAVAGRLGLGPEVAVACSGGVLSRERPALWPAMAAAASEMGTSALPRAPQLPPVLGAVLLAWRLAGMPVGPGLAEALARAFPDPS
jgi:N-acetylglucosamine kinase-like BadF-type ATPase